MHRICFTFIFLLVSLSDSFGEITPILVTGTPEPKIRVRVNKSLKNVIISGTDLNRTFHIGNQTKSFSGRKKIKFNCNLFGKSQRFKAKGPTLLASLNSMTGLVTVGDKKYMGTVDIVSSETNDSCDVIQETRLEDYISGLLAKEMNSAWPIEALKAQAVAARSYALHKMETDHVSRTLGHDAHYDLESSEKHQVSGSFFDITRNTDLATSETMGEVLVTPNGKLTPIFFHAKCGGKILRPDQVWSNAVTGYNANPKGNYCHGHGQKDWVKGLSYDRFASFLKWLQRKKLIHVKSKISGKKRIKILKDNRDRNSLRLYWGDIHIVVKKPLFRRYFGRILFPSNNFSMNWNTQKSKFIISGSGLGHGVGMCQLGALDMAKKGWGYRKILSHYFPGHKIEKAY
ncbi:putative exported protein [Halobacteriovorax marinus SJ]|uniref:Exported protein n=1 Tax=Halobacteriovorax marinus (strain ATCC BAA-682 / DSM 15412 / SJ) TaxID=862908 RepID=E1X4N0_HALMS|nr:SpoIID/LytB domain-containing protein [Halobacteriovorax marinus]CBW25460.1 putative exported protein [Halobacteriovorax marinus SJ]